MATYTRPQSDVVRFGSFEVDLRTGELCKDHVKQKLSGQPFQLLAILLERPGDVFTRDELQKRLWPDTFVDAERNLNTAINKIREALGDSAEQPQFVETLPRRGYRFIARIETVVLAPEITTREPDEEATGDNLRPVVSSSGKRPIVILAAFATCLLVVGLAWAAYKGWHRGTPAAPVQRPLTRLTFDEGLQTGATWSPDGRYLAYSSDRGGKPDIWVQQVSGGNPIQITKQPGQNLQPSWSPDGKYIAYRSEEGDGGIYVIPALGGEGFERKIAPFGYYPQWSPDSAQVLFRTHFTSLGVSNRFFTARLDGSPPSEVLARFIADNNLWASAAAWHPDGKRITLWVGSTSPSPVFWTVPVAGGPGVAMQIPLAIQKELAEASGATRAVLQLGEYGFTWSPAGDAIYLVRGYRGARNVWKLTVEPHTLQITGVDRLTTGPGPEAALAVSADGKRLAFTASSLRIQTWLFPFDAGTGQIKGNGRALTSPGRTSSDPQLSHDGTKVAYVVPNGESYGISYADVFNELWVQSLADNSQFPVFADTDSRWGQLWSPDGKQLIYDRKKRSTGEHQGMLWSSQTHQEETLTGLPPLGLYDYDWSVDGKWLLGVDRAGGGAVWLSQFPPSLKEETAPRRIAWLPGKQVYQPHISNDDRWVVFEGATNTPNPESALYVVPAAGGSPKRITDGRHWDDKPRWSPDGRTIYFVSQPGGFFNLWGLHFDPAAGKAIGAPFQISHFDSDRLRISHWIPPAGLSLTQDKLVLTMSQESGNIWILDNVHP